MTKNITLAIDSEKLARLRIHAAKNRTSVNALFRKHIDDLLDGDERREQARARLKELMEKNIASDAERQAARAHGEKVDEETWRWSREETYSGPRFNK
jgi:hypothetical protein